ncbi:MAG: hypothetical protein ACK5WY_03505 [Holosporaceae bacterium]
MVVTTQEKTQDWQTFDVNAVPVTDNGGTLNIVTPIKQEQAGSAKPAKYWGKAAQATWAHLTNWEQSGTVKLVRWVAEGTKDNIGKFAALGGDTAALFANAWDARRAQSPVNGSMGATPVPANFSQPAQQAAVAPQNTTHSQYQTTAPVAGKGKLSESFGKFFEKMAPLGIVAVAASGGALLAPVAVAAAAVTTAYVTIKVAETMMRLLSKVFGGNGQQAAAPTNQQQATASGQQANASRPAPQGETVATLDPEAVRNSLSKQPGSIVTYGAILTSENHPDRKVVLEAFKGLSTEDRDNVLNAIHEQATPKGSEPLISRALSSELDRMHNQIINEEVMTKFAAARDSR